MSHAIDGSMTAEPITVAPDVTIQDAQEIFRSWGMRHLPVTENAKLVGLISDRDIYRALALGRSPKTEVRECMSKNPYFVFGETPIGNVAKTMAEYKYGCVVVVNQRQEVRGIFTTTDALNILAKLLYEPDEVNFRVLSIEEYLRSYRPAV